MAPLLTTSAPTGVSLSPEDRAALIIQPLERESLALRTSRVLPTLRDSVQVPMLTEDVPADFVAEGAELPQGQPIVNEVSLRPVKIAALSILSCELAEDSEPEAVNLVGHSIARSIKVKLDQAFLFAATGGLPSAGVLTGASIVDGGVLGANLDGISDAITSVEAAGGAADVIVMNPTTWGRIAKVKTEGTSNAPLLGVDGTPVGERSLFGVQVRVDSAVVADVIGVWDSNAVAVALRRDVKVESDTSRYFDTDSVAVRATLRADWTVLDPQRVVKISSATPA